MQKLEPKHIKKGVFIWYSGSTSTGGWNCPAVITQINRKKKTFRLRSLDDMIAQPIDYDFEVDSRTSDSRETMRLASAAEVEGYVYDQSVRFNGRVDRAEKALNEVKRDRRHFRAMRKKLHI